METIIDNINAQIDEAIESVRGKICKTYGADPDQEDADEINSELSEFVSSVLGGAFVSIREEVRKQLNKTITPGSLTSIDAKLDILLNRQVPMREVQNINPVRISGAGTNQWGRYQTAWYKWKRSLNESVPTHAGERSKMCSANYAIFKKQSEIERNQFLNEWA